MNIDMMLHSTYMLILCDVGVKTPAKAGRDRFAFLSSAPEMQL